MAQRTAIVRTKEESFDGQHRQDRRVVVTPTSRGHRNRGTGRCYDGHSREPSGQKLWCFEPPEDYDCSHQSDELTIYSPSISKEAQAQSASIPSCNPQFDDSDHLHIHLFHSFRIIQTRMMVLAVIHGLPPNQKPKSILEACTDLKYLWGSTLHTHNLFPRPFFQIPECLHTFHSRSKHATQILRWVCDASYLGSWTQSLPEISSAHQGPACPGRTRTTLLAWTLQPLHLGTHSYLHWTFRLSQSWNGHHPRMATTTQLPFICQFFHPRKGILKKPAMNTNAQFGLATLWRRAKHKFTPSIVRGILTSERFQNRRGLWTIIHALGSNTKARFEQTKMLRSNDGGLTLCYALRRLANNIQEHFRTLSLNAIDAAIKWWNGKPAPRATALRAPWSLTPNLQLQLKQFLRQWHLKVVAHQVPCHTPSFKTVFIKHSAVLDQLCNHKQAIIMDWSSSNPAICCCKRWVAFWPPLGLSWILAQIPRLGGTIAVIAEGSLLNKIFPTKKEYQNQLWLGLQQWTKRNGLPSIPRSDISELGQKRWSEHSNHVTCHITKSTISQLQSTFEGAIFHCEDKHSSSLRIYCPCLYYQAIEQTFQDPSIFEPVASDPSSLVTSLVTALQQKHGKAYPWAVGNGRQLPAGYILAKKKKTFRSGRPIISFVDARFRPMLNILARLIFQLIPVACPDHFASGDVYTLLTILKSAPVDVDLILANQDLAGFFTSIDQERSVSAWFMLLDFLRPHMNVSDNEAFSVYPGLMHFWPRANVCMSKADRIRSGTSFTMIFRVTLRPRNVRPLMMSPGLLVFPMPGKPNAQWNTEDSALSYGMHRRISAQQSKM